MRADELTYDNIIRLITPIMKRTGLRQSAAFLFWFLENVYRLEETVARDSVCDQQNDKGIDGIYVDHNNEEIHFFQAKLRESDIGRIGDVSPKSFMGSVRQFDTAANIDTILKGNAGAELKRLIVRLNLKDHIANGYSLRGCS